VVVARSLHAEFQYYLDHQDSIVDQYDGKYVVIKDGVILAAYPDEFSAVSETQKAHALGTFLVQRVSRGTEAYSQSFHSRVVFS
jgi:hypothetical protein